MQLTATQVQSHSIPADVLMEVFSILLDNDIAFKVEEVNEKDNTLLVNVSPSGKAKQAKAMENIQIIVSDYDYYRYGSHSLGLEDIAIDDLQ